MVNLGEKFPIMKKKAVVSVEAGKEFKSIRTDENVITKKWRVLYALQTGELIPCNWEQGQATL